MKNVIILTLIACLAGCATSGTKIEPSKLSMIQQGVTHKSEVVKLAGKPNNVINHSDGSGEFIYFYSKASNRPENFIPVVGIMAYGLDMENEMTRITWDQNGIVQSVSSSQGQSEINSGFLNSR